MLKKNAIAKLSLIFLIIFSTHVLSAKSQKYILTSSSPEQYSTTKRIVQSSARSQITVLHSLDALSILIVESDNSLNQLKNIFTSAVVESDFTFPAPRFNRAAKSLSLNGRSLFGPLIGGPSGPVWNISMIKAPEAWEVGVYGENTRVMMLDTGIDKDHPSIKDNFEQGKDFAGGLNKPYPYFDSVGHGTHTSGIVAGTLSPMGMIGVAPRAKILMARVCSSQSCSVSAVLNGLNWALQEKVDVVNISLSRAQSSSGEINAIAKLESAGVVVVASTGNDGKESVLFPASLATVVGVGSVNEDLQKSIFSNWGQALDIVGPGADVFSAAPQGKGAVTTVEINGKSVRSATFLGAPQVDTPFVSELIDCGDGRPESIPAGVKGKTAYMKRGEIKFIEKYKNAVKAGAGAVLFYNNESGLVVGDLKGKVKVPVALIEQVAGEKIKEQLVRGEKFQSSIVNTVSDFVSNSGTSMATPHVTGVVALIRSKNKSLTPIHIREILAQSAFKLPEAPQNYFGAGLVDAGKAVLSTSN